MYGVHASMCVLLTSSLELCTLDSNDVLLFFFFYFETRSHAVQVVHNGLYFLILLIPPPSVLGLQVDTGRHDHPNFNDTFLF